MAEECADDDEDKTAIRSLRKRVLDKLKAHHTLVRVTLFSFTKTKLIISFFHRIMFLSSYLYFIMKDSSFHFYV